MTAIVPFFPRPIHASSRSCRAAALPLALLSLSLSPSAALAAQPVATPTNTATTQTVTTPASAKLGKPTTIAPAKTTTAPATTTPAASSSGAAPAGTATAPATTPTTAAPTNSTPATSLVPGSAGTTVTIEKGVPARAPARARGQSKKKISTGAILLAVLAALAILACCLWALARARAFEPHWLLSFRHAMAEAGYRMSNTWSEFQDWVRYGR
ncbi:MAG TPA: hypothetical protein VL972_01005 [Solirubrobacteraceae bacterium]|nr:hypothetical protein [Solirubrobacteraceae bacterium]